MRDPKRISRVIDILQYYWFNKVPDWRFGQLISNLASFSNQDIFYMEDEQFIELVKMYFEAMGEGPFNWKEKK